MAGSADQLVSQFAVALSSDLGIPPGDAEDLLRMLSNEHFRESILQSWRIYYSKGQDYTRGLGDSERTDNFKQAAEFNKISPLQAWGAYFYKQIAAIFRFIGDGKVESEPIESRIHDVINYSILLLLLIKEKRHVQKQELPEV